MRPCAVLLLLVVFSAGMTRARDASTHAQREAIAKLQAMDLFPDLEREGSEMNRAVTAEIARIEREEPAFFKLPGWPVFVARRVASRIGVKPRTVAAIRTSIVKSFSLEPGEIQQLHGIQIVEAKLGTGTDWIDVLPQIAARVSPEGLVVDCDESLASALADDGKFERHIDERAADYWRRQRGLLEAAGGSRGGKTALRVTFELHSRSMGVAVKEGERLSISEEGEITISKIAPGVRIVRDRNAGVTTEKGSTKKKDAAPSKDTGGTAAKTASKRTQPR